MLILPAFWKSLLSSPLCLSCPQLKALLQETFRDLLSPHSSCSLHTCTPFLYHHLVFTLSDDISWVDFNFGHTYNLPHQLDSNLVGRGHSHSTLFYTLLPQGKARLQFIRSWLQVSKSFHHPSLLQHSHSSGLLFIWMEKVLKITMLKTLLRCLWQSYFKRVLDSKCFCFYFLYLQTLLWHLSWARH